MTRYSPDPGGRVDARPSGGDAVPAPELQALGDGRNLEALRACRRRARLRAAARIFRAPQARYLSYLRTLSRAGWEASLREGADFCRQAIALEFFNADLFWNYGRVLLVADRRKGSVRGVHREGSLWFGKITGRSSGALEDGLAQAAGAALPPAWKRSERRSRRRSCSRPDGARSPRKRESTNPALRYRPPQDRPHLAQDVANVEAASRGVPRSATCSSRGLPSDWRRPDMKIDRAASSASICRIW